MSSEANGTLTYVGPLLARAAAYSLQAETSFTIDRYGLDNFQRTFAGNRFSLEQEIKRPRYAVGAAAEGFPAMSVSKASGRMDRSFGYITVDYVGKLDGTEPTGEAEDSVNDYTIQINMTNVPLGQSGQTLTGTFDLDYRAPMTTYHYATKARPQKGKYDGQVAVNNSVIIINSRGLLGVLTGEIARAIGLNLTQLMVFPKITPGPRTAQQVGLWWQVTEVQQTLLFQDDKSQATFNTL